MKETKEYRGDNANVLSYKQKFDFDKFGNLYRKASSNPIAGQQTPVPFTPIEETDINQQTNRFTPATGTVYDEAGNVTTDAKFRAMSFGYDANGRMVKASKANTPDAASVYDASGQRVAECVNDVWKFFIYDVSGKMIAEYGGIPSADEGGVKYPFQDWQGSTRAITSNGGFVESRQDFTAFGEEVGTGVGQRTAAQGFGATNNLSQKYAQTERDGATGLDHTWFRKLENKAGRWTSPDPYNGSASIGDPQSFNRYAYVNNQPTNYVDPSGLNASSGSGMCFTIIRDWYKDGVYSHSETVGSFCIGGSGGGGSNNGGSGGGGGGGGGSNDPAPQSPPKKPKCSQDKNGENNKAEIEDYLKRAGLDTLIDLSSVSVSKEGIVFDFINRAMAVGSLNGSLQVIGPTIFAGQHTDQVGAGARDYRGKTGQGELGNKSLQIEVGRKGSAERQKNKALGARGYADLDCDNPAQDVVGFARHATHIVLGGLRNIF